MCHTRYIVCGAHTCGTYGNRRAQPVQLRNYVSASWIVRECSAVGQGQQCRLQHTGGGLQPSSGCCFSLQPSTLQTVAPAVSVYLPGAQILQGMVALVRASCQVPCTQGALQMHGLSAEHAWVDCGESALRNSFRSAGHDGHDTHPGGSDAFRPPVVPGSGEHWQMASEVELYFTLHFPFAFTLHVSLYSSHCATQVLGGLKLAQ